MLRALRISNLAVIDEVEVAFGPGLTVLTGETGAGKSILVDALALLLGGRADAQVVRAGSEEAAVEGTFEKTPSLAARLTELGLPDLGDEVSVRRIVHRSGRTKVYVNGALVTVGVLARVMKGLVDISGQHEHVGLYDASTHRALVDAQPEVQPLWACYLRDWAALQDLEAQRAALGGDERQAAAQRDFLRFQLDELSQLSLGPNEEAELEEQRRRLAAADRLRRLAADAEALLASQEGSATELVGRALGSVSEASKLDGGLWAMAQSLRGALSELEEGARALGRYAAGIEADPAALAEVEERLDLIRRLCRKHGCASDELTGRQATLSEELAAMERRHGLREKTDEQLRAALERAEQSAAALTAARQRVAERLGQKVREGLAALGMPKAQVEVRVAPREALSPQGRDEVEIYFGPNPGEPPRPLAKVASGGEASRLLLATKRAALGSDACGCYVLDEVDAGVGGAAAEVVGRMIRDVSAGRQVLCITHLPQVAAYADRHLYIEKRHRAGRAVSRLTELAVGPARTAELARMLSGLEVTHEALGAAEALVRSVQRSSRSRLAGGSFRRPKAARPAVPFAPSEEGRARGAE